LKKPGILKLIFSLQPAGKRRKVGMTKKIKVLLISVSVFTGLFISLSVPMGIFLFATCPDAHAVATAAPEPSIFPVITMIGVYFISLRKRR
jgi:hypothetical protein